MSDYIYCKQTPLSIKC